MAETTPETSPQLRPDARLRGLVGAKAANALEKGLDLVTVEDLLRHYPRRHIQRGELTDLSRLELEESVTVLARVVSVTSRRMRQRKGYVIEATVTDGRDELRLTFFGRNTYHEQRLRVGRTGLFAGKVGQYGGRGGRPGVRQLVHPEYELLEADDDPSAVDTFAGALIPIYPAAAAIKSWEIARCLHLVIDAVDQLPDPVPPSVAARLGYPDTATALRHLHLPETREQAAKARARLRFEEAFVVQAELARRRHRAAVTPARSRQIRPDGALAELDAALPFTLTDAQRRVGEEIATELAREHPMHRLLQGEVGSGKTVVALRAMLTVVDTGGQAALLAPTEVLAHQHHRTLTRLLGPLAAGGMLGSSPHGTRVALLTGSMSAQATRAALLDIASGDAGIVVGTHALLEDRVQFRDLGLVIVDEQHRFGVDQRAALTAKAGETVRPHVLVMTATPIPRTVAMTVFGDLDISTLDEVPAGRAEVSTHVVPARAKPHFLQRTWERAREELLAGHRVYIVTPRIGTDEEPPWSPEPPTDDTRGASAVALAAWLRAGPLKDLEVGVLHGRMPTEEKDAAMAAFESGQVPCLVATTVVEVGVDVATASTMIIMDADRFGVSQLHQLRGRIGRGSVPGVCLLVTFTEDDAMARDRLDAVAGTRNGFELARVDLEQRREGDVLGAAQSGRRSSLRLLSVIRDEHVIREARQEAELIVESDPRLDEHPGLRAALDQLAEQERAAYLERT